MSGRDVRLSKTLSWILRHQAPNLGIALDSEGFASVDSVLSLPQLRNFALDDVRRIVATNSKQRFALETDAEERVLIRANQGHSLSVENLELKEITNSSGFPLVVHGTFAKCWEGIKNNGLSRMKRQHVHFAPGLPGNGEVISGMRKTCDVLIFLDLEKAMKDGLKFYRSANDVILCPGDSEGLIGLQYFKRVMKRDPKSKVMQEIM